MTEPHGDGSSLPDRVATTPASVGSGLMGVISGIAPHVLHHVGPLSGSALIAGATGTLLFGVIGIVLSIPMLLRVRRRFGTWAAPVIAGGLFTLLYLTSSLVIGPILSGSGGEPPPAHATPSEHAENTKARSHRTATPLRAQSPSSVSPSVHYTDGGRRFA